MEWFRLGGQTDRFCRKLRMPTQAELDDAFDLLDRQSAGSLAAFTAEPVLSSGGVLDPPPGYLAALKQKCAERGMLLILDEAQTGLGRTGTMFAFERDRVVPDIFTLSKTLGAGMPLSAMMTSAAISATCDARDFLFYTTHVSDPLPAAVGLKVLEIVARDIFPAAPRRWASGCDSGCSASSSATPVWATCVAAACCSGSNSRTRPGRLAAAVSDAVTDRALELGLSANIVRAESSVGVMRIAPPLTITESEIDLGISLLDSAIAEAG